YNSNSKSRDALRFEAKETEKLILPDVYPLGSIDLERLRRIANAINEAGIGKSVSDIESFIFGPESTSKLPLTKKEQDWLVANPIIRVHNETSWPPFNFFEKGKPQGLSIDYMNLLAQKLNLQVEYITGPSWNEFMEMIRSHKLDVMLNIVKTEDRTKFILFTDPYIKNPNVIASKKDFSYETMEKLKGKTVALPQGFFYEEVLKKEYPDINLHLVEDVLSCLKAVIAGNADAMFGEAAVINHLIVSNLLTGLHISGEVILGNEDYENLRIGIRDDWPLLHTALQKAKNAVSQKELTELYSRWIISESISGKTVTDGSKLSVKMFTQIALIFIAVIIIVFFLFRFLSKKFA
ncbi:transporter substrate-binding domain-containing protein, partial [bacterium]|nr:transporter substrate-binding domain-containing protein [bacterium]